MWSQVPLLSNNRFQQWELFDPIVAQQWVPTINPLLEPTVAQKLELLDLIVFQQWSLPP
jgi:hypothetical protein